MSEASATARAGVDVGEVLRRELEIAPPQRLPEPIWSMPDARAWLEVGGRKRSAWPEAPGGIGAPAVECAGDV